VYDMPEEIEDRAARAAVLTGNGKAFSAGGDLGYLAELGRDPDLRARTIAHGRDLVLTGARIPAARAVESGLATLDFATTAEESSFATEDFRVTIGKLTAGDQS
jgi:enoyl-CoA hydratase/carnithine racemase